jgi:hypothetical protein
MEIFMKENLKMERRMEKENSFFQMDTFMKETMKMDYEMEKE